MNRKIIVPAVITAFIAPAAAQSLPPAGGTGIQPSVSLIVAGRFLDRTNPGTEHGFTGFIVPATDGDGHAHAHEGLGEKKFSLRDTELAVSANIGSALYASATFAMPEGNKVEAEEAYLQTTGLGHGATLKGGRFLSAVGYLNEHHLHAWDFADQPLAYQAMLGGHLRQDGVQARWIAPADLFIEFGAELAKKRNNGNGPMLFASVGGDIGTSNSWRAGISHLRSSAKGREFHSEAEVGGEEIELHNSFTGGSRISGVNFVWKWAPDGNATATNLKLQGEYFRRKEAGEIEFDEEGDAGGPSVGDYLSRQSGWYLQAVYQFKPRWRAGLRHDRLDTGNVDFGANNSNLESLRSNYTPRRNTVMVDFSPSELSRLRLQFARDKSREGQPDNQFVIQYIMSFGAHGAHKF